MNTETWICESCGWVNHRKGQCEGCYTEQGQVRDVSKVYQRPAEPYDGTGPRDWIYSPPKSVQLGIDGTPWG
jgi:hypothetical protein